MKKEELIALRKTRNEKDFNEFIVKYNYDYGNIPINKWKPEIREHYINEILGMTEEKIEEMQHVIREYKNYKVDE